MSNLKTHFIGLPVVNKTQGSQNGYYAQNIKTITTYSGKLSNSIVATSPSLSLKASRLPPASTTTSELPDPSEMGTGLVIDEKLCKSLIISAERILGIREDYVLSKS